MSWGVILLLACVSCSTAELVDYCTTNTFISNSSWMQFTKEATTTEYVVKNKFKSLHCCAKGYRSIEWYKDSRAYPWAGDVSSFILYPEAANQTVYTQLATEYDSGNYTCLLKNDTHHMLHTIILTSVEKPSPEPRATFRPTDKWSALGSSIRLYCEAFVGRINLPDAHSEISWKRIYPEGSKHSTQQVPQHQIQREYRDDSQIIGAYFSINHIRSDDYGQYMCSVTNGDSLIEMPVWLHHKVSKVITQDNSIPWKDLTFFTIISILIILTLSALYIRFGSQMVVRCKSIGVIGSKNVNKEYDVLVLSSDVEASTTEVMVTILNDKYGFKSSTCLLSKESTNWYNEAIQLSRMSHSIIAVISPAHYSPTHLKEIIAKLHTLTHGSRPIIVCLQELPKIQIEPKDANGENLQILINKSKLVLWRNLRDESIFLELQRLLPLPCKKAKKVESNLRIDANSECDPAVMV